jgi:hypothetical protein
MKKMYKYINILLYLLSIMEFVGCAKSDLFVNSFYVRRIKVDYITINPAQFALGLGASSKRELPGAALPSITHEANAGISGGYNVRREYGYDGVRINLYSSNSTTPLTNKSC